MILSLLPLLLLLPIALAQEPSTNTTLPTLPNPNPTNSTLNPANSTLTNSTLSSGNSTNSSLPASTPLRPATIPTSFLNITAYSPGATAGARAGIVTGPNDNYIAAARALLVDRKVVASLVGALVGVVGVVMLL